MNEDNDMQDAPFFELRISPRRSGVAATLRWMVWAPVAAVLGLARVALRFLAALLALLATPLVMLLSFVVLGAMIAAGISAWQGDMVHSARFGLTALVGLILLGGCVQLLALFLPSPTRPSR